MGFNWVFKGLIHTNIFKNIELLRCFGPYWSTIREYIGFLNILLTVHLNTLRTGYGDLHSYITTVEDGLRRSPFVTR
jgi:hypothetical protein